MSFYLWESCIHWLAQKLPLEILRGHFGQYHKKLNTKLQGGQAKIPFASTKKKKNQLPTHKLIPVINALP